MEPDLRLDAIRQSAISGIQMPRAEAMLLLAETSEPEAIATLSGILANDPDVYASAAAARALGRISSTEAEDSLLRVVNRVAPVVQRQIFLSLARTGTPRALLFAGAAAEHPDEQVAAAARFAAEVIAHRYNIPGHEWMHAEAARTMELAEKNTRSAHLGPLEPVEDPAVSRAFATKPFGLEYSRSRSLTLDCGGKFQVVVLSAETSRPASALERKHIAGAVLTKSIESEQYSISHVVLTSPDGQGGVRILVRRTSGIGGFAGSARIEGDRGRFELRSVPRPGAVAIVVEGTVENGRVELTRVEVGRERIGVRVPAGR